MNYEYLFAVMGTALLFFMYKAFTLRCELDMAKEAIVEIALGKINIRVNHDTKEIFCTSKEDK